ncbi:adenine nucleotide alpha hydrolases-like protein [Dothidotthia symphoricarpi CBS 119687]|uniref:Cytoplasmic tRNA 2-thiolation protein 1 n=1 Tax=Dothidotthia symphoricarpi CBS 119687 TaxID=1392245 RepID=A0A6A6AFF7_9PLEO|nr:adenine nucleotide alpha hydrolases-like protein [Dothidotthia symphoricarpi CBS 119687]KAF2130639.1 adenine nucleotide alpha hydrolases-like protein [Dothidotthia symphoricarpi CBS 119687]
MAPTPCALCKTNRALILRPKDHSKLCKTCFIRVFETETHHTITSNALFHRGERVAIGASGGKDSTVLASVLKTLNERYDYGLDLILLSIDEGIKGYRDDSLETVKRNAEQYGMDLTILGYSELYGWTMDQVVEQVGKKGNCTYCGVFRRQALDRGAARLGVKHVVTGHNADDVAETVLMNLLRGDLPRLSRTTSIVTSTPSAIADPKSNTNIKRSKPLKYAYEKEIVLYAHHKNLDYFSTECIYSPEAFRGSARALIKNLERVRPSAILDVVRSGEDMARLVPGSDEGCGGICSSNIPAAEEEEGGCGSANGRTTGGEMATVEAQLAQNETATENGLEVEITARNITGKDKPHGQHNSNFVPSSGIKTARKHITPRKTTKQVMGQCKKCGYLSSQDVCKACMLLEGLNKSRPKNSIEVAYDGQETHHAGVKGITEGMKGATIGGD